MNKILTNQTWRFYQIRFESLKSKERRIRSPIGHVRKWKRTG